MRPRRSLAERFWEKVDHRGPDDCWPWMAATNPRSGYGQIGSGGRAPMLYAHRVAYELQVGPIPPGATIDHMCHNADSECPEGAACEHRRCMNGAHLLACPTDENTERAAERRTHCRRGHPLEGNVYIEPNGYRRCRLCNNLKAAESRHRRSS